MCGMKKTEVTELEFLHRKISETRDKITEVKAEAEAEISGVRGNWELRLRLKQKQLEELKQ